MGGALLIQGKAMVHSGARVSFPSVIHALALFYSFWLFFCPRTLLQQLQKLQALVAGKVSRPYKMASTQTGTCLMVCVLCPPFPIDHASLPIIPFLETPGAVLFCMLCCLKQLSPTNGVCARVQQGEELFRLIYFHGIERKTYLHTSSLGIIIIFFDAQKSLFPPWRPNKSTALPD